MKNLIIKKISYSIIKNIAYFVGPFYLLKITYLNKIATLLRSAIIKNYLQRNGAIVGENFVIGSKCMLRIQDGAIVHIGDDVVFGDSIMLNVRKGASLSIGNDCHINYGSRISCFKKVTIGQKCLIASYNNILDHDHQFDLMAAPSTSEYFKADIIIGEGVWLGTKVQIGKGISIGNYSVVGANSVVTKNLCASAVFGGVPTKLIRSVEE